MQALPTIPFFSPEFQADPFPTYAAMRRAGPVCRVDPFGFLALTRHADVASALKDARRFSSEGFRPAFKPPWVERNPGADTMLSFDPPEHTKLRALINRAFVASTLGRIEPLAERTAAHHADMLGEGPGRDVISSFAVPLVATVLGDYLVLDPALHPDLKRWSDALTSVTPEPQGPDHVTHVNASIAEMERVLSALIDDRRKKPGTDIVSALIHSEVSGERLSQDQLVAFLFLIIAAGLDTTVTLVCKSLAYLVTRPELWAALRESPGLVPAFLEEMLRFDPPTHSLFRMTTEEITLDGVTIPAGMPLMLFVGSANRDASVFAEPDAFRPERGEQGSLVFGHGPHFCLGAALARLEARIALEALLSRYTRLTLRDERLAWRQTMTVRTLEHLHISFER